MNRRLASWGLLALLAAATVATLAWAALLVRPQPKPWPKVAPDELAQLRREADTYRQMPAGEQSAMLLLHGAAQADPDLWHAMQAYAQWYESLAAADRAEIDAAESPAAKAAAVRRLRTRRDEEALRLWLPGSVRLQDLTPRERGLLAEASDDVRRQVLVALLTVRHAPPGDPQRQESERRLGTLLKPEGDRPFLRILPEGREATVDDLVAVLLAGFTLPPLSPSQQGDLFRGGPFADLSLRGMPPQARPLALPLLRVRYFQKRPEEVPEDLRPTVRALPEVEFGRRRDREGPPGRGPDRRRDAA